MMAPNLLADVLLFLAGLYFFLATRHQLRFHILSLFFTRRSRWRAAHVFHDVELKVSKFLTTATLINLGVGVATAFATFACHRPAVARLPSGARWRFRHELHPVCRTGGNAARNIVRGRTLVSKRRCSALFSP